MENFFTLKNLPMPPSSNHQYAARSFPGRHAKNFAGTKREGFSLARICPTGELERFDKKMKTVWAKEEFNNIALHKARAFVRAGLLKGCHLDVRTVACFPYFDLYTKEGQPRKMDGTNRIKALHDVLAELLEVDDSWFWNCSIRKAETKRVEPYCVVLIGLADHLTLDQMKERGML